MINRQYGKRNTLLKAVLLLGLFLPTVSLGKSAGTNWEELFEDSFPRIYTDSLLLSKEILPGCDSGHRRGRFLWLRVEDLPNLNGDKSAFEISRLKIPVRYGEFYFEENGGKPYLEFHPLDFSGYKRDLRYSEICPTNKVNNERFCSSKEIKFAIYDRDPKVTCRKPLEVAEEPQSDQQTEASSKEE